MAHMNVSTVAAVVARRRIQAKKRAEVAGGGLAPEDEDFIAAMIAKYDKNFSGGLGDTEIKTLMTDLNDGKPVQDTTVAQYLGKYDRNMNGEIDKKEVRKLIAAWYINVEDSNRDASRCCAII